MGEPAPLTPAERAYFYAHADDVVRAVVNDEEQPSATFLDGDAMPDDTVIFKLSQLVIELREKLSAFQAASR